MPWKVQDRLVYGLGEPGSGFRARRSVESFQDYEKIVKACRTQKQYFEDDEFPASDASLGDLGKDAPVITWKRPHEIVPEDLSAKFIVEGADRFDVKQGFLGNCWFLAAAADLTMNPDFFSFCVPHDINLNKNYYGVVHFRFWQFGRWIDVVVDDRLPCKPNGKLAFVSSQQKNEFWAPLLEKAFAKLNGSYAALDGGLTFQALQDLTGGFTELLLLETLKRMGVVGDGNDMFKLMVKTHDQGAFMGSSVKVNKSIKEAEMANGLIQGHAYSVTDLQLVKLKTGQGSVRLIRLRNPWGNKKEWKGEFCDGSPAWDTYISEEDRTRLQTTFEDDGEFWMTFDDFLENFERVEVCHTANVSTALAEQWTSHSFDGKWVRNSTDGGPLTGHGKLWMNPQFKLVVEPTEDDEKCYIIICLMKNEKKAESNCNIGNFSFEIYELSTETKAPKPLSKEFIKSHQPIAKENPCGGTREITVRFSLPHGKYCIIPHTKLPGVDKENSSFGVYDKITDFKDKGEVDVTEDTPEEIEKKKKHEQFFKDVADQDEMVDWWELKMVLDKTFHSEFQYEGFGFSEESCRSLIAITDLDLSGKLSFSEFIRMWFNIKKYKEIFDKCAMVPPAGGPRSLRVHELIKAFKIAGYTVSRDLISVILLRYGDRNGQVWLVNFIIAAIKLQAMLELFKTNDLDNTGKCTFSIEQWMMNTLYA